MGQRDALRESDGPVYEDMERVSAILRSQNFMGTPPVWFTASVLQPYLEASTSSVRHVRGPADFVKPATQNQAKSSNCSTEQKKNYYDYEKAMKHIASIYQMGDKTWTQYEVGTHITAHFHLCSTLSITILLANRFIFNWFVQSRRKRSGVKRKSIAPAADVDEEVF